MKQGSELVAEELVGVANPAAAHAQPNGHARQFEWQCDERHGCGCWRAAWSSVLLSTKPPKPT